jgi:hypothetical protein
MEKFVLSFNPSHFPFCSYSNIKYDKYLGYHVYLVIIKIITEKTYEKKSIPYSILLIHLFRRLFCKGISCTHWDKKTSILEIMYACWLLALSEAMSICLKKDLINCNCLASIIRRKFLCTGSKLKMEIPWHMTGYSITLRACWCAGEILHSLVLIKILWYLLSKILS